jgi:hypothetical protein
LSLITNTEGKRLLNTATQELKQLLSNNRNDCIKTPTESTDYSLWKATKKIKQVKKPSPPLGITRNMGKKAHAFVEHSAEVSQPHPSENEPEGKKRLSNF